MDHDTILAALEFYEGVVNQPEQIETFRSFIPETP